MKTSKKRFFFFLTTILLFLGMTVFAQEEEKTKVHLKVMNNDEVTVDTTFHVSSGADSDELKKMIQEITGIEDLDLHISNKGELHTHGIKMTKEGSASAKTIAVFVGEDQNELDIEIDEGNEIVWVKKGDTDDHKIILKSGKGDEIAYVISSGDNKEIKVIQEKGDVVKVIHEDDLEEVGEDKAAAYYVVKNKTGLDDVEEIVIKKKDGSVIILEGDEIKNLEGENFFIKTHDDEGVKFDIYLKNEKDGTVVVKKDVKVRKKEGETGEEEIEIVIMEKDTTKAKKEIKEKKAEKEKK